MSVEIETLIEVYSVMKEYVPSKERQAAADALMGAIVDSLSDLDLTEMSLVDQYLKRSYTEYFQESEQDDEDNYDFED